MVAAPPSSPQTSGSLRGRVSAAGTTLPSAGKRPEPRLPSQAEAGEEVRPRRAPLQGVHPDWIASLGGEGGKGVSRGGRGIPSTARKLHHGRDGVPPATELKLAPFHYTSLRLPPRSFFVGQLWLGRRHYHIALRGGRHLTA